MDDQLHARIDYAVQRLGGSVKAAMVTDIPKSTLNRWTQENGPDVPSQAIRALAAAAKVSVSWMVTGHGAPDASTQGFFEVPLYDVRLAAGVAKFSEAAKVVTMVPIDADLLRQIGRTSAEGLGWVESDGDSMAPTIPDGSRVLLDLHDTRLREGVFGFRLDNSLRVKRLLRHGDGVEIISDNTRYPSERMDLDQLEREQFQIIGRAKLGVTFL
ncbi:MAG: S24 family peptidase [Phenylobacterium sp.]|nr:S24 family peptidase [Phenylobacterium sp.]